FLVADAFRLTDAILTHEHPPHARPFDLFADSHAHGHLPPFLVNRSRSAFVIRWKSRATDGGTAWTLRSHRLMVMTSTPSAAASWVCPAPSARRCCLNALARARFSFVSTTARTLSDSPITVAIFLA